MNLRASDEQEERAGESDRVEQHHQQSKCVLSNVRRRIVHDLHHDQHRSVNTGGGTTDTRRQAKTDQSMMRRANTSILQSSKSGRTKRSPPTRKPESTRCTTAIKKSQASLLRTTGVETSKPLGCVSDEQTVTVYVTSAQHTCYESSDGEPKAHFRDRDAGQ